MKSGDSKLLLGLIVGAAVGVAIGYLATTDKKEELLDQINTLVGKVKDNVGTAITKIKEAKGGTEELPEVAPAE
ncbi:hypothetical protein FACS189414_5500 [Bacteroidia bacterium]|nr:hypothetical protein AGMMS49574_04340 [Bacteroidia bacterium]GHU55976.1 hypothetical protein FACS189411_05520 [Bacteroidia bacterium]GHU78325.1 hypothetical protein FACS189414_5500 [Bacteroidia bacterium]GHV04581.1 hypothetical protein FACS189416_3140 [Bacteroidia bacterium]